MTSIAELGIKVDSTDAAQASSDLDKLTAAGGRAEKAAEGVAKGADKASASIKKQKDELADLLGEIDPTVKALGRLDDLETKLAKQKKLGALDASTFSEYQGKIDQSRANLGRFDDTLTRTGNTAKQTAAALRGVPAQFTDIAVSLQGGQAPLTVLLQQGGQLKDMFGGIGPAAKALGGYVLGLVNPFTLAAAAAAALGLAYYQGSKEADEYNKALIFTGNAAGTSASQLASMAQQVSATIGTTGAAAEVLAKLAGNGKIASGSFDEITEAALQMEKATGRSIDETIAEFAKIAKDPVAAAKELNDQYNFLTASVYSQIVALQQQGDTIGAANLLTETYANTIQTRTGEVTANLGLIESAWQKIKSAATGALDATLDVGRTQSIDSQIANLEKIVAGRKDGFLAKLFPDDLGAGSQSTKFLEGQIDGLKRQKVAIEASSKAQGDNAKIQRDGIDASVRLKSISDSNLTNEEKRNKLIKEYKRDVEALRKANPNDPQVQSEVVTKTIQNIRDKNKDPKAAAGAVNLTEFNDSKNQRAAILSEYKNAQKELEASQKAGIISQESYLDQRTALIRAEREEVTGAFEAEISALEAAKGKASTSAAQRIQLDQKIADARASMAKAQKEADSELEVIATNEQGRLAKQAQAIKTYTDALDQQNVALRRAGNRAAEGVGQGDSQNAINGELNGIADRANQQRLDLARDKADKARNMSAEEYQAKLDAINRSEKALSATVLSNYEQMSEAQGDWRKGATSAFSNYLDSARDVAGQTRDLFTNAFSSMEDAAVNFAIAGKGSFSDFAKSVLADMARIAVRQGSSQALSALFGLAASAGASYFGGGSGSAGSTQAGYSGDLSGFTPVASAKGNVFDTPGLSAYSNSVVSSPTIFPFAKGAGLMGEAGPEAIMPLTRTAGGQLGVRALGGSGETAISVQVTIASDGTTSSTTDDPAYDQFGKDLADFVDQRYQKLVTQDLRQGGKINRAIKG